MEERSKRILKNTLYLYVRTFLTMAISLFTVRIVLRELGVDDYGIYNVVGGIIVLFSFINGAMSSSTQRFLNFEIGASNDDDVSKTFSLSLRIHFWLAAGILLLAETVGLWIVKYRLNLPAGSETASMWVYHTSVAATVLTIVRSPLHALIIAYEKMSFFAWVSIIEAVMKLAIAFMLFIYPSGKLIIYSILIFLLTLLVSGAYWFYCRRSFPKIKYRRVRDHSKMKEMISYSSWNLLGSGALVASGQGISIVMNIFFGVVVNTAIGIANQVNAVASAFLSNFQTAFMPQITKSYAAMDMDYLNGLILKMSRLSFLLIFVVSYPIFFNARYILGLWLGEVPDFSVGFLQVVILSGIFDALSGPLWMAAYARGDIRNYQITVSAILVVNLLLCFLVAKLGMSPIAAFATKVFTVAVLYFYRLVYLKKVYDFQIKEYLVGVATPVLMILLVSVVPALVWFHYDFPPILSLILSLGISFLTIWVIGLTSTERSRVVNKLKTYVAR